MEQRMLYGIGYNLVDKAILLSEIKLQKDCLLKLNKSFQSNDEIIQCEENQIGSKYFLQLPVLEDFYYKVFKYLKKLNIVTRPKNVYSLDSVIKRGKDVVKSDDQVNTVYCLNCLDCNSSYDSESKRALSVRVAEHRRRSKKSHSKTPISLHLRHNEHQFEFGENEAQILDIKPNYYRRIIRKMIHIHA